MIDENKLKRIYDSLGDEERILLYSIGALDNTPIRNKTKLQKLLFLISNVFKEYSELLEFEPHLFGPYSEIANDTLEDLIKMGLIELQDENYKLTEMGLLIYSRIKPKKELEIVINDFKEFLNDLSMNELLTFIYVSYPEYIGESVRWEALKIDRVKYAISLFRKQKISFSKAAQIADMNSFVFADELKKRGIKWRT